LPNTKSVCEAAKNCSNPAGSSSSGTWNGCNPNTVTSINWRASLVPAAAVIPAPRAYTIIAAVKTPVVCHWVAGLLSGPSRRDVSAVRGVEGLRPGSAVFPVAARVGTGENPQQHVLCPLLDDGVTRSCRKPPSVEAERWLCLESRRGRILATTPPWACKQEPVSTTGADCQ